MPADRRRLLALIHIGKAELGLADDTYRDMIEARSRVKARTAAKLTLSEMSLLIDDMKARGFAVAGRGSPRPTVGASQPHSAGACWPCAPRKPREKLPSTVVLAVSVEQLYRIERLRREIRWKAWNGFSLWLRKYHGIDTVAGIRTSLQASAIIEGLTGMWKWQRGCKCHKV
jgi:hypothetical protein